MKQLNLHDLTVGFRYVMGYLMNNKELMQNAIETIRDLLYPHNQLSVETILIINPLWYYVIFTLWAISLNSVSYDFLHFVWTYMALPNVCIYWVYYQDKYNTNISQLS